MEIALAMEVADKQASNFRNSPETGGINYVKPPHPPKTPKQRKPCFRCGEDHVPQKCRFKDENCRNCKSKGHIAKMCKKKAPTARTEQNWRKQSVRYMEAGDQPPNNQDDEFKLFQISQEKPEPSITLPVKVNGEDCSMELDTGASVSIMSEEAWKKRFPKAPLEKSTLKLRTYTGEALDIIGQAHVQVAYQDQTANLPLQIIKGKGPSLFGRNWLRDIKVNWGSIKKISCDLDNVLTKHKSVFNDELGTMQGTKAKLFVKSGSKPKFFKPRPVPHALKGAIEQELDRLEGMGVIEKVRYSEWAAPIVPVVKPDNSIRVCGDYKITVNSVLEVDQHPLPNPEELFVALSGGVKFSKLDLSRAYQQILLDEDSREYVTINTHKGLYRPTRLPFGVSSASAIFQSKIEQVLQGIPMVVCRVDDILISGKDDQEHLSNLSEVLTRLESAGLRLKRSKCQFMQPTVEYLGYRIDAQGLHAIEKKVEAIRHAPAPENQQQLRSFLGMINYYSKFISNYSTITHPLNELLKDGVEWKWSENQQKSFQQLKDKLSNAPVLTHFSDTLPLKLDTDASQYGIGAVISHVLPSGEERPIAYASRTLSKSERNYSQIEKEALSIIFGVKKFHQYLYGRKFLLVTDHKPLTTVLGPKSGIPTLAAARLQRWALLLAAYQYDIEYRSTEKHANADCLSRLPIQCEKSNEGVDEAKLINLLQIESLPMDVDQVRKATRNDPMLSRVLQFVMTGWPEKPIAPEITQYFNKRHEITVEDGCLLWGIRVIIPKQLRERVLHELHTGHPGIVRMKSLARLHVWWPNLDKDIATIVQRCNDCQKSRNKPQPAPLHPWDWPKMPWQRAHIDFAGPFMGKMFLIVVDSHSKWLEVEVMSSITSEATIEKLRDLFARYGIPQQLVSDNGSQFTSREFAEFMKGNGIKHTLVAPYHPRSNGQAERFVQTFKQFFKTEGGDSIKQSLARFLFSYRTTPNSTTGQTPAELFLNRRVRTRLDLIRPDLGRKVFNKQSNQKTRHDKSSSEREFALGEQVLVQNFRGEPKWLDGTVSEQTGPVSYKVLVGDQLWKRHIDQMHQKHGSQIIHPISGENVTVTPIPDIVIDKEIPPIPTPRSETVETIPKEPISELDNAATAQAAAIAQPQAGPRYPTRQRKAPQRLGFDS